MITCRSKRTSYFDPKCPNEIVGPGCYNAHDLPGIYKQQAPFSATAPRFDHLLYKSRSWLGPGQYRKPKTPRAETHALSRASRPDLFKVKEGPGPKYEVRTNTKLEATFPRTFHRPRPKTTTPASSMLKSAQPQRNDMNMWNQPKVHSATTPSFCESRHTMSRCSTGNHAFWKSKIERQLPFETKKARTPGPGKYFSRRKRDAGFGFNVHLSASFASDVPRFNRGQRLIQSRK